MSRLSLQWQVEQTVWYPRWWWGTGLSWLHLPPTPVEKHVLHYRGAKCITLLISTKLLKFLDYRKFALQHSSSKTFIGINTTAFNVTIFWHQGSCWNCWSPGHFTFCNSQKSVMRNPNTCSSDKAVRWDWVLIPKQHTMCSSCHSLAHFETGIEGVQGFVIWDLEVQGSCDWLRWTSSIVYSAILFYNTIGAKKCKKIKL